MNESDFLTYTFPYEEPPPAAQRGALGTGGCRRTVGSRQEAVSMQSMYSVDTASRILPTGIRLQSPIPNDPNQTTLAYNRRKPRGVLPGLARLPKLSRRRDGFADTIDSE